MRVFNANAAGVGGCYDFSCLPMPPTSQLSEATAAGADAFAVYEVITSTNMGMPPYGGESVEVPVYLCQGSGGPGGCHVLSGTIKQKDLLVRVSLAPISNVILTDAVAPLPRFAESGTPIDLLRWPR
jgi:hypothetical protein